MSSGIRTMALLAALIVPAAFGSLSSAALTRPSLVIVGGAGVERGVARLVCERRAGSWARVRAVLLDIGEPAPNQDVLLAPAHGLPDDPGRIETDCRIIGVGGSALGIARFWRPEPPNTRLGDDWVVVMTREALEHPATRLRAGLATDALLEQLVAQEWPVNLMLRTAAADRRDCRIVKFLEPEVFAHSCEGRAGLSGAPMLIGVDGAPMVIGIHVARILHPLPERDSPSQGVGLAIGSAVASAIEEAAALARSGSNLDADAAVGPDVDRISESEGSSTRAPLE